AMARQCAGLVRDLEASLEAAVTNVDSLIGLADEARQAVERLIPALGALAEASARASAPTPVAVLVQPLPTVDGASEREDGLAEIVADGWPAPRDDRAKLKN